MRYLTKIRINILGTFQFKMQVKENITKYVGNAKMYKNMWKKHNCSNANATINGDYYFLSSHTVKIKYILT
jgi:hypothetical protein